MVAFTEVKYSDSDYLTVKDQDYIIGIPLVSQLQGLNGGLTNRE